MSKYRVADIVEVDLNPTRGHEQKKVRPCVVINVHPRLDLITVFPVTDSHNKNGNIFIEIKDLKQAGLTKPSVIDTFQIRTLSLQRVNRVLGTISNKEIFSCRRNLALIFEIDEEHLL